MGFLERRQSRKNKTPDLSRYANFQNQSRGNDGVLSTNAANSALRTYSLSSSNSFQNNFNYNNRGRTNSLNSFSSFGPAPAAGRTNSLLNYNHSGRTSSLSSSSRMNAQRSNSFVKPSSRSNSLRSNSLMNSSEYGQPQVIIHTTKTMDEQGRLKSITTETIRKYGSFELVKTETTPMNGNARRMGLSPPVMKYADSVTSQELGSIAEEEDEGRVNHPYKSILKNGSSAGKMNDGKTLQVNRPIPVIEETPQKFDDIVEDEDDDHSGNSIYSDAFETMPRSRSKSPEKKSILKPAIKLTKPVEQVTPNRYSSPKDSNFSSNCESEKITENVSIQNNNNNNNNNNYNYNNSGMTSNASIYSGSNKIGKKVSIEDIPRSVGAGSRSNSLIGRGSIGGYNDWFKKDGYKYGVDDGGAKKTVSEDAMYEKAYELAMKKVYGGKSENSDGFNPEYGYNNDEEQYGSPQFNDGAGGASDNVSVSRQSYTPGSRYAPSITSSVGGGNGFKRYSLRQGGHTGGNKNYNYQLSNRFGSEPLERGQKKDRKNSKQKEKDHETDNVNGNGNENQNQKETKKKKKKGFLGGLGGLFKRSK